MKAIRTILACIRSADNKYNLINHGDKIVIGLSGGKDSIALTYALSLYQKFSHTDFIIQPVTLDLGFPGFDPSPLKEFCSSLGLSLIINDSTEVYKILKAKQEGNHLPCSICSRMKKAAINKVANDLGFNKVAFAHHADDAIETLILNEIHGARVATFSPKMHLEKADITFIRPLILARESDIAKLVKEEKLITTSSHCPADKLTTREDIKVILQDLYKKFPMAKENFLTMLDNYSKYDLWEKDIYYQINQDSYSLKPVLSKQDMVLYFKFSKCKNAIENISSTNFLIYYKNDPIGCVKYDHNEKQFIINDFHIIKQHNKKELENEIKQFLYNKIYAEYNPCEIIIK